jgi:phosphoglycerate dehydrogenase-like enzyme
MFLTVGFQMPLYLAITHKHIEEWHRATILATATTLPRDPKLVPNLKFIHFFSAGTDHVTNTPIYKDSDIPLTTSSGIHGPQIAEWVVLQLLAFNHHEKELLTFQREHKWGKLNATWGIRDYVGQRLGVLGYGSIGRQSSFPSLSFISTAE